MENSFEKYLPWLILREIPFLGNRMFKKLIKEFQSPEKILYAPASQLKLIERISSRLIKNILNHKKYHAAAQKELELIFKSRIKIVTYTDPFYPVLLKEIPDPPPFLTYLGDIDNTAPCISIVGSRNATSYGLNTSEHFSYNLAQKGFQIVSGLARGIDSMAHRGALKAGEKTVAVLGSGLNRIYPKENRGLFHDIAARGTIFSEFKVNADPVALNFPIRNRIIAGLSCGSVIVEAAQRSGSLITARLAGEYNREVFAVPGSIKSKKSQGTHSLLKQGATLVENEMDIIDELHQFIHAETCLRQHASQQREPSMIKKSSRKDKLTIFNHLEVYPVHIDELIEKSKLDSSTVTSQLLNLELEGRVMRHQGNYYSIPEESH